MRVRFAIGLAAALAIPAAGVSAGPCGGAKKAPCTAKEPSVNFLAVPDITKEIILAEPVPPPAAKTPPEKPAPDPYTGPYIGADRNERAPLVGFHWSTD
jgi:hypothetical protein